MTVMSSSVVLRRVPKIAVMVLASPASLARITPLSNTSAASSAAAVALVALVAVATAAVSGCAGCSLGLHPASSKLAEANAAVAVSARLYMVWCSLEICVSWWCPARGFPAQAAVRGCG